MTLHFLYVGCGNRSGSWKNTADTENKISSVIYGHKNTKCDTRSGLSWMKIYEKENKRAQMDEWTRKQNSLLLIPPDVSCISYIWLQYACMPVRKMVTGTRACRTDDDCAAHSHAASVCVTPSLENQTRFIRVTHPPNTHMLFVGYPPHLQYAGTYCMLCSLHCLFVGFVFLKVTLKCIRNFEYIGITK